MSQTYQHTKSNALQSENLQDSADTKDQDPTASNPDAQELSKLEAISLRVENDFRDFPVMAKIALKKILSRQDASPAVKSAGRVGLQQGKVSELTAIATLKPGGGDHLRRILKLIGGNMDGAYDVGTVHDMRFVILANDSKILFCTAYDGDWDTYIEDFATKIDQIIWICCLPMLKAGQEYMILQSRILLLSTRLLLMVGMWIHQT